VMGAGKSSRGNGRRPWWARLGFVVAVHAVLTCVAYLGAFALRYDLPLPAEEWRIFVATLPFVVGARMVAFAWLNLYRSMWRFVGLTDMLTLIKATTLGSALYIVLPVATGGVTSYPRPVLVLDWVLCLALVGAARLARRALAELRPTRSKAAHRRALVVGAGEAGQQLLRALRGRTTQYEVMGLVDDDSRKQRKRIHGLEVLGTIDELPVLCRVLVIDDVLVAMPSSRALDMRRIAARCRASRVTLKTVPSLEDLVGGRLAFGQLQEVLAEDLLVRSPTIIDRGAVAGELEGRCVVVTGAGGSIGSELCRQVASFSPSRVVLLERAETSLYEVHLHLGQRFPEVEFVPCIADVTDETSVQAALSLHSPTVVYHAAAYKHVALMEEHPLEAIENNLIGTENVAVAARRAGVDKVVFVSSDKAVQPVGVMGMTKRAAENLLLTLEEGPTAFVSVRFGNVLGSDGSVLPTFRWQLARGGPLTVTDTEARRYFILLSEAAQLLLQAGAMGRGGEVFVLEMGEPVRIGDLAEDVIRLSGLTPGKDVDVDIIGLRPGERLTEALTDDDERLLPSAHEKIFVARKGGGDDDTPARMAQLRAAVARRDAQDALRLLKLIGA